MMYEMELSNKRVIKIDEDDYKKFEALSGSGNFIRLKQGIVNPSFVVDIVPIPNSENKEVQGYIDEKRGVFVVTGEKTVAPRLEDKFKRTGELKSIGELLHEK